MCKSTLKNNFELFSAEKWVLGGRLFPKYPIPSQHNPITVKYENFTVKWCREDSSCHIQWNGGIGAGDGEHPNWVLRGDPSPH